MNGLPLARRSKLALQRWIRRGGTYAAFNSLTSLPEVVVVVVVVVGGWGGSLTLLLSIEPK